MSKKRRISCYLSIALVVFMVATQVAFVETAAFAENREKEIPTEIVSGETADHSPYHKENLERLAKAYQIEPQYLDYIVEVEKTFELTPYELFALIAQESNFIPQTRMDGGSLSYSTTQMKLATAKTAYMAITDYYKKDIAYPTHDRLEDKYYATMLAGGYLKYLHDVYQDKYESYTAYRWGIGGRLAYYKQNGNYESNYALQVAALNESFAEQN